MAEMIASRPSDACYLVDFLEKIEVRYHETTRKGYQPGSVPVVKEAGVQAHPRKF